MANDGRASEDVLGFFIFLGVAKAVLGI